MCKKKNKILTTAFSVDIPGQNVIEIQWVALMIMCPSCTSCKEWMKRVPKPMVKRIQEYFCRINVTEWIIHFDSSVDTHKICDIPSALYRAFHDVPHDYKYL